MIKLGVIGHRFLAELEKIEQAVDQVLDEVIQSDPDNTINLLTALAEGADRLVTHRALRRSGTYLTVVLPMPKTEYEEDFGHESVEEFNRLYESADRIVELPPEADRVASYKEAGLYILRNCEILIAIWDGQEEQGQGGSGFVATLAREREKPLAWIHAGNRIPGTQSPTSLGPDQGQVTFERFAG